MVLSKEQFDRVLKGHPDLSISFIKQLSGWLKRDEQALETEAKRMSEPPRISWFDFVLLIGVSTLFALIFNQSNPNGIPLLPRIPAKAAISTVTVAAAAAEHRKGEAIFVDAITANFYDKKHIKGAVNMPLALFDLVYMMTLAEENKSRKIIVYGGTISRLYDLEVANKLILRGFKNTRVLEGGLSEWEKKGFPVEP
jgi:rhodanese-related sulfurtransferase